jgi:hypothetical protein
MASAKDGGRVLNEKTACSQITGATVMAIGMTLLEETVCHRPAHPFAAHHPGQTAVAQAEHSCTPELLHLDPDRVESVPADLQFRGVQTDEAPVAACEPLASGPADPVPGVVGGYQGRWRASQQSRYGLLDDRLHCIFIHRYFWGERPLLPPTARSCLVAWCRGAWGHKNDNRVLPSACGCQPWSSRLASVVVLGSGSFSWGIPGSVRRSGRRGRMARILRVPSGCLDRRRRSGRRWPSAPRRG